MGCAARRGAALLFTMRRRAALSCELAAAVDRQCTVCMYSTRVASRFIPHSIRFGHDTRTACYCHWVREPEVCRSSRRRRRAACVVIVLFCCYRVERVCSMQLYYTVSTEGSPANCRVLIVWGSGAERAADDSGCWSACLLSSTLY